MKSWSFIVGVGKPLHPELGSQPFAESDATALDAAFGSIGIPKDHRCLMTGPYTTKAAVVSRLRTFRKSIRNGDRGLLAWFGSGLLDCWDTLPDDRTGTSIRIDELLAELGKCRGGELVLLLSVPDLAHRELSEWLASRPGSAALLASGAEESPQASADVPGGIWTRLVLEALEGRAAKAGDETGRLTTASLQRYLEREMPRQVRKHFESPQTPILLGNPGILLREPSRSKSPPAIFEPAQLKRFVFRSESVRSVRELSDFRKSYTLPEKAGSASRRFVQRLAEKDIRTELERIAGSSRERFGHRRKDHSIVVGQEGGSLRTPDFEFLISVDMDPDDPTRVVWRRELGRFESLAFARETVFGSEFGPPFDQLVFELAKPIDVRAFAERLEESPAAGATVSFESDRECELTLRGFAGSMRISRQTVIVRGRTGNASGLFDQLIAFLGHFDSRDDLPSLRSNSPPPP